MANWDDDRALGFPVVNLPKSATVSVEAAVEFLVEVLVAKGQMQAEHADRAVSHIVGRERFGSTAVGGGVAIPHSKSDVVKEVAGAVGHSLEGMAWPGAMDGKSVYRVCLILTPTSKPGTALRALEAASKHFRGDRLT